MSANLLRAIMAVALAVAGCAGPGPATETTVPGIPAGSVELGEAAPADTVQVVVRMPDESYAPRLRDALVRIGLRAEARPGYSWTFASAAASTVTRDFGVPLRRYRGPDGRTFTAPTGPALVPPALAGLATEVIVRSGYVPALRPAVPASGLKPIDVSRAYDTGPLRARQIDGRGEKVVFFELNDNWNEAWLDRFSQEYGLPQIRPEVHGSRAGLEVFGEAQMDLEVIQSIAPGVALVVYELNAAQNDSLKLMQMIVDEQPGAIVVTEADSCEKGLRQSEAELYESVYTKGAERGMTFMVPSGDLGAYDCIMARPAEAYSEQNLAVSYYTSPPHVTSVGGCRISVNEDGSYFQDTVWNWQGINMAGGGGLSIHYPRPDWQIGPGTDSQPNPRRMRMVPDVCATADNVAGVSIYEFDGFHQGGGTSQAGPIWAAFTALINQYLKGRGLHGVGFVNPALYRLASTPQPFPPFHDVVLGNNYGYAAGPGYDMASGLGSPDVWNLAQDLEAYQRAGGR